MYAGGTPSHPQNNANNGIDLGLIRTGISWVVTQHRAIVARDIDHYATRLYKKDVVTELGMASMCTVLMQSLLIESEAHTWIFI